MYIEISRELFDHIQDPEVTDVLRSAADTMREGRHFVCTENYELALLITNVIKDVDKRTASFFLRIHDHFSEIAGLKNQVESYISIVYGSALEKCGRCIRVGHQIAQASNFWHKSLFVVENLDDAKTYGAITQALKKNIALSFEPELGGGNTTCSVIENKLRENYIVFTIVDSDKKSPDSEIGPTAKLIFDSHFIQNHPLCRFQILNVCELENIFFSQSIWRDFMTETQACKIAKIAEVAEEKDSSIRCFLDVKSGMSYKQFDLNSYMQNTIDVIIPDCDTRREKDGKCKKCKRCECKVVSGVGRYTKDLIKNNDFLNKMQDYYEELPSLIALDWNNIARIMSTWACGAKIQATECR